MHGGEYSESETQSNWSSEILDIHSALFTLFLKIAGQMLREPHSLSLFARSLRAHVLCVKCAQQMSIVVVVIVVVVQQQES